MAWLVEVGRFVEDRWLAEEAERPRGEPLDEEASWDLWDQCSEKYLRDLRTEARQLLKRELGRRRAAAFIAKWRVNVKPVERAAAAIAWTLRQAGKAIVGAISVIAFGLFVLWLFPGLSRAVHSTVDRIFPPESSNSQAGEIANH